MPDSNKVRTRIIIPADTLFDFAGDGLDGNRGKLKVDAGAGFGFNEWGRLILNLLENGGIGYHNDQLCINTCEVASRLAGFGLGVRDCKLAVNFCDVTGCGLTTDADGKFAVDVVELAGRGLKAVDCEIAIDDQVVLDLAKAAIEGDSAIDTTKTTTAPHVVDIQFRYKPNGYGYNCGLEIVKSVSVMTILRNAAGRVVRIEHGEVQTTTQEFDFGCGVVQNVAERAETPAAPNFYAGN